MLVLLLRQREQVEGSDLAKLLLKESRAEVVDMSMEMEGGSHSSASSTCY